jgi:septal ring factor EnvC (AmiA/AmiB activator)
VKDSSKLNIELEKTQNDIKIINEKKEQAQTTYNQAIQIQIQAQATATKKENNNNAKDVLKKANEAVKKAKEAVEKADEAHKKATNKEEQLKKGTNINFIKDYFIDSALLSADATLLSANLALSNAKSALKEVEL